jgi:hypothetical protein
VDAAKRQHSTSRCDSQRRLQHSGRQLQALRARACTHTHTHGSGVVAPAAQLAVGLWRTRPAQHDLSCAARLASQLTCWWPLPNCMGSTPV